MPLCLRFLQHFVCWGKKRKQTNISGTQKKERKRKREREKSSFYHGRVARSPHSSPAPRAAVGAERDSARLRSQLRHTGIRQPPPPPETYVSQTSASTRPSPNHRLIAPLSSATVRPFNQVYYQSIGSIVFHNAGLWLFEHINKSSKYAHTGDAPHSLIAWTSIHFYCPPPHKTKAP